MCSWPLNLDASLLHAYSTRHFRRPHSQTDLARHSSAYVGKVRSNFIGTEFTCYDSGVSPAKASGAIRGELDLRASHNLKMHRYLLLTSPHRACWTLIARHVQC